MTSSEMVLFCTNRGGGWLAVSTPKYSRSNIDPRHKMERIASIAGVVMEFVPRPAFCQAAKCEFPHKNNHYGLKL
jgi:hypothetical protein